jgi:hypothetical protein
MSRRYLPQDPMHNLYQISLTVRQTRLKLTSRATRIHQSYLILAIASIPRFIRASCRSA